MSAVNSGQFKKGQHWRPRRPYWDRHWLVREYVDNQRSARDIASEFAVHENAILFWLKKHAIPARSMAEVRAGKHWGSEGELNPMFGRRGPRNPNWRGGRTPWRQQLYASSEWRRFRRQVFKRDKVCRLCASNKQLEIHHIEPFSLAPLLVMFLGNVILLCKDCHQQILGQERRWRDRLLTLVQKGVPTV